MTQPGKPPNAGKKRVDFDDAMLDKSPATYERNLVAALIHSHKLFLATDKTLCPWDDIRGTRRPDFSVSRYNILYEAISAFFGPIAGSVNYGGISVVVGGDFH